MKVKRDAMRRSLGHLINRGLSRGWRGWLMMVAGRAAALQLMRRGVRFMMNRKLAKGWMALSGRRGQSKPDLLSRALRHLMLRGNPIDSWKTIDVRAMAVT